MSFATAPRRAPPRPVEWRRAGAALVSFLIAGLLNGGCEKTVPTQLLVVFEADDGARESAQRLRIDVDNQDGERSSWNIPLADDLPGATDFPVTLPLVPRNGDPSRTFSLVADLVDAAGQPLFRQRLRSGYEEGALREVRLRFGAGCEGELCSEGATCRSGNCVDACLEPGPVGSGDLRLCEPTDGGVDGEIPDARPDGSVVLPTTCVGDHQDTVFCDGFESGDGSAWDELSIQRGRLSYVTDPVYRGNFAMRARTENVMAGRAFVYARSTSVSTLSPDIYVRLYVYVPRGQPIFDFNIGFVGGRSNDTPNGFGGMAFGLGAEGRPFIRSFPDLVVELGPSPLPTDRWVCLEAHLFLDVNEGSIALSIDDVETLRLGPVNTVPTEGVSGMNIAIGTTGATQLEDFEVFVDEVVADRMPIGCD
ncbi:MAG: hypothetical protein AAGF12_30435 [Myxococcota bacterium]